MFEFQRTDGGALGTLLDASRVTPRCKKARVSREDSEVALKGAKTIRGYNYIGGL
jgi:hypothetical protein